jgi:hypothetical protein
MAAQLGETTDPKELVPGNAATLEEIAGTLKIRSGNFEDVGSGLGNVRIPGWTGSASDAFWDKFSGEKRNWLQASDAMTGAASAIIGYAGVLSRAQQQAGEAIAFWDSGDHGQAQEILATARHSVLDEGDAAARALAALGGSGPHAPGWLSKAGGVARTAIDEYGAGKTNITHTLLESKALTDQKKRKWGATSETSEDPAAAAGKPSWAVKLAEVSGEANVWNASAKGEMDLGGMKLAGAADIKTLGVEGSAGLSVADGKFEAKAGASAYLAKASAEGSVDYGYLGAKAAATGFAGAEASATAAVGKEGVHLGAEAFAGAKATASASADVGGVGAGVTAEGWAGAGASASLDAGMKDGKFTVGGELGVGLGLGGKISTEITVDPGEVVDTVGDAADAVGDGIDAVGDELKSLNPFG